MVSIQKHTRNLSQFYRFISQVDNARPSLLLHSAIVNALSVNEVLANYPRISYFGYFPAAFYKSLSEEVGSPEETRSRNIRNQLS
jgi:hypothetical protein